METQIAIPTKVQAVRSLFEQPDWYFSRRSYDIRIRMETVRQMVKLPEGARVLDIGSGDGSVSLPLLAASTKVTMLDLSSTMLSLAQSKVPTELQENVEFINDDFTNVDFGSQSFDVILCIGLLVHVVSPADLIAKMVSLLKPNGKIILECSDAAHFASRFFTRLYRVKSLFRHGKYGLNAVSYAEALEMLRGHGFSPEASYRYSTPFPGVNRFFSQETLYKLNRGFFGHLGANRNAWMGNEYISMFGQSGTRRP
jgi:2-polyprenyl-3-methyl-5-hydroxy-6-metoxy-1,4-benzoquinol methylase